MLCAYCLKEKNDFTLEHIFPDALGGDLCGSNLEIDRVCTRCNNLSGQFIDGNFIRSWLCQNYSFQSALKYIDWGNGSPIPLMFYGLHDQLSTDEEVCEYWGGPCGEHIYYFHSKDDLNFESYTKGDPIKRRKDKGYAIIFGTEAIPQWLVIGLLSFKQQFRKAKRYSGNYQLNTEGNTFFFDEPTESIKKKIEELKKGTNDWKKLRSVWQTTMDQRFLTKMALGFGYKLLGEPFLASSYANTLSKALWEPDPDKRKAFPVRGKGFLSAENKISHILGWDGGHTISLKVTDDQLALTVILFGKFEAHVVISDEPQLWRNLEHMIDENGHIYVIVPQRNIGLGPITLPDYLSHKAGNNLIGSLIKLEAMKIDPTKLPECS